ncbi:hypothetical protein CEXT_245631 [Caerostris extrusa]|uniref:Uncharacterized protein n=1 Tax=Caerostris extrusa TaxID=172846 RepID=A0AAV4N4L5_CAEEX|nr:hypothetical protein CEXT_245631 [Caerostris extrusa]
MSSKGETIPMGDLTKRMRSRKSAHSLNEDKEPGDMRAFLGVYQAEGLLGEWKIYYARESVLGSRGKKSKGVVFLCNCSFNTHCSKDKRRIR